MASAAVEEAGRGDWPRHVVRASDHRECPDEVEDPGRHRERIEPWLSALLQAEHLSLLIGSGFTTAVAASAGAPPVDMSPTAFRPDYADAVGEAARESAARLGRFDPNIEDQVRTVIEFHRGLAYTRWSTRSGTRRGSPSRKRFQAAGGLDIGNSTTFSPPSWAISSQLKVASRRSLPARAASDPTRSDGCSAVSSFHSEAVSQRASAPTSSRSTTTGSSSTGATSWA